MNLNLMMIVVFLAGAAVFMILLFLFVHAPAEKRHIQSRIEAIKEASIAHSNDMEVELLRQEVLSRIPAVNRILSTFPPFLKINLFLQQAAMDLTVGAFLGLSLLVALVALFSGLLLRLPTALILILVFIFGALPFAVVAIRRNLRFAKFEEQFSDAIDLLARAVRAGHAFTTGLELIGTEMADPVAMEFRRAYDQQNLGLPLRDTLQNLLVRVPLPDVHIFVTALIIQRESGGNLAEILDNLSRVIRERFKLYRQIKVFTAQGRITLWFLIAIAPIAGILLYMLRPGYISRLFTDPLGQRAIVFAACLQLFGYLIIRRIVQPKI
jgi:tight adherence protein B